MRALRWIAALWPGLLQAWVLGSWRGLALATAFTAALNLALVTTFVWPRWPAGAPAGLINSASWVLVLGLWVYGLVRLRREWNRVAPPNRTDPLIDQWFREAQTAYLRGHWSEAETLVKAILERRSADVESRLLRASIERRMKQYEAARQTLEDLKADDAAIRWRLEIAAELAQLAELANEVVARAA
jgi:hypothetical protein